MVDESKKPPPLKVVKGEASKPRQYEGILSLYEETLSSISSFLVPILGEIAFSAILKGVSIQTRKAYPLFPDLKKIEGRIELGSVNRFCTTYDGKTMGAAFRASLEHLLNIIGDLTGDLLVSRIRPLVDRFKEEIARYE